MTNETTGCGKIKKCNDGDGWRGNQELEHEGLYQPKYHTSTLFCRNFGGHEAA